MSAFLITARRSGSSNDSWVRVPNEPMADRVAISRPPSSGVVGGGVFCVSASGAGYPLRSRVSARPSPTIPIPRMRCRKSSAVLTGTKLAADSWPTMSPYTNNTR
jgi:hypothetical protein